MDERTIKRQNIILLLITVTRQEILRPELPRISRFAFLSTKHFKKIDVQLLNTLKKTNPNHRQQLEQLPNKQDIDHNQQNILYYKKQHICR